MSDNGYMYMHPHKYIHPKRKKRKKNQKPIERKEKIDQKAKGYHLDALMGIYRYTLKYFNKN
jgi:hypothetical protein